MSREPRRRALRLPSHAIPYVVLLISLLLTGVTSTYTAAAARANDRLRFENLVEQTHDDIRSRLETYISLLRATAGLFAARDDVSRAEFTAYVERIGPRERYPGIQGIGFSVRIPPGGVAALESRMRRQGIEGFTVWPEGPRDEYHAIIYLEPLDRRNQAAIGYDMFSEPTRRAAMERARDAGQPAASGKVTLVQEIDDQKQAGFLIYVPVYRGGRVPATLAGRREALLGYAYSPFRADDLLNGIFGSQTSPRIAFEVFDGPEATPEHLLHRSAGVDSGGPPPAFTTTETLNVAGRDWTIRYSSLPALERTGGGQFVPFILLPGILVSGVLFLVARAQVRARDAAEAAVRVRDEFLSVAAHELKTPLTALLGNAQLLLRRAAREGGVSERDQRALRVIVEQGQRLNKLVTTLLDHSRIQSGRLTIERAPLDLGELLRRIVDETRPMLAHHTLALDLPAEPLVISGDELRLTQVVHNLIDNAIKYSPEGGPVAVSLRRCDDQAEIQVTDRGMGIPADALANLFQQFYRAPNIDPRSISGMGIGLYVIREIVAQHGGAVDVASVEGEGSTFSVRLPLALEHADLTPLPPLLPGEGVAPQRRS
ncbi:MAG TPA: CHASE domain-containing protein [Roseiflexaceae bacterium]|nr:CHASE domain-containing protein [Roseiflexaceae bacterium]